MSAADLQDNLDMPPGQNGLDRRAWAAEQLNLAGEASWAEARAEFIRRLPDEDFVPPQYWDKAVRLLHEPTSAQGASAEPHDAAFLAAEEKARTEIEAFAAEFFDLRAEERRQRWQELLERCSFSLPLKARLMALKPGLEIEVDLTGEDQQVVELTGRLRELFVLTPLERAIRRRQFLDKTKEKAAIWKKVVHAFAQQCPELYNLEPLLISQLSRRCNRRQLVWHRRFEAIRRQFRKGAHGVMGILLFVLIFIGMLSFIGSRPSSSDNSQQVQPLLLDQSSYEKMPTWTRGATEQALGPDIAERIFGHGLKGLSKRPPKAQMHNQVSEIKPQPRRTMEWLGSLKTPGTSDPNLAPGTCKLSPLPVPFSLKNKPAF